MTCGSLLDHLPQADELVAAAAQVVDKLWQAQVELVGAFGMSAQMQEHEVPVERMLLL